ncbi:transcriptional regulator (plasmid) [Candidatus Williamhamiltonella defendens]|uniref:Transcriptional regulator n=1 Tax=Candidatus Williamhamiltonella defendens TaxID=138072 RepID=A0A4P2SPK7_9ENTR|nr:helix-turn-helix transcriptional regulator [Candidatus Hamiltonella defensa]ASV34617.1 transcriptional regulator [Candidatus Hamiltonella defensa]ASV34620.1 transcriptional regulator [Candidatus Hamiltonella defensa]AWK17582.1 transcriptional regulator [Candidatus Hamiltonella defensa]AWK17584.1 transcriptional regulator [Candidatus Hamiltonella defensa]AWK17588.1 transcriptional regulator [Candidatus Hamiltonella defensa]
MRTFDFTRVAELHVVFPELTSAQFQTALLFSLGLTKKEIASTRGVSYPVVRDTLQGIKNKLDMFSLSHLISLFHIRLVLFALHQSVLTYTRKIRKN